MGGRSGRRLQKSRGEGLRAGVEGLEASTMGNGKVREEAVWRLWAWGNGSDTTELVGSGAWGGDDPVCLITAEPWVDSTAGKERSLSL